MGKRGRGARKREGKGEGKGEGTRGLVWVPRAKGWMDGCECNCLIGETAYAVIDETVRAEAHPSPPGVAGVDARSTCRLSDLSRDNTGESVELDRSI